MNDLLDFIKNPKDREDFFIAIIVIFLFGAGILYSIFPRNQYDGSLSEQELADNLEASLSAGNLKSKIFTDLESTDELEKLETERIISAKEAKLPDNNNTAIIEKSTIQEKPILEDQEALTDQTEEAELYDKKQKEIADLEAAAAIAAIEKANRLQAEKEAAEELKNASESADADKAAEELRKLEAAKANELKLAEAEKAAKLKAAEELKIKEAEKAKSAEDAAKNRTVNQSPKTDEANKETATTEYDNKKSQSQKKPSSPKAKTKPSGPRADCVVVVGAFKNASGVEIILKKLKAANYKTTTGYIRGLRYVGVPIFCDKNNDKVIKDLNEKFDKEAWVLRR